MFKNIACLILSAGVASLSGQPGPKTFPTPDAAREALLKAASNGLDSLRSLLGPDSADILRTGDDVLDQTLLKKFVARATQKSQLEPDQMNPNRMTLLVGAEEWPFAVPLLRKNGSWYFDVKEGKTEIRNRVIGADELDAVQACRGYVEAQKTYAQTDWNGNGVLEYATKIGSSPKAKDGLYWPGDDSPVASAFARAFLEGYGPPKGTPMPYHGYFYRVLLAQGPDAPGGAQDYVVHGLMIGGFALIAWPAEYGSSGIMTFIVNQDGVVYEKDLGPQTGVRAKAITKFNPDKTWRESAVD